MVMTLNLKYICQRLKTQKPPYRCPAENCGKIYKSFCGIQLHLYKCHKESAKDEYNLSPASSKTTVKNGSWPTLGMSSTNESISESKSMLTFKANGKIFTINERTLLELIDKTSSEAPSCSEPLIEEKSSENGGHLVKKPVVDVRVLEDFLFDPSHLSSMQKDYYKYIERTAEQLNEDIEYDMDEEDCAWLELFNERRKELSQCQVENPIFELAMDRFEKESYFLPQSPNKRDRLSSMLIDEDAVCAICWDGECQNSNAIIFCDMCNLAVHQDCYGVPLIPISEWLCQRCLHSPSRAVDCCLCPNKGGAFKLTDCGLWAHVVCALWIPEVTFANTVYLEPIENIKQIHPARWSLPCYICKQRRRGACIQCLRQNCRASFHVTCAQQAGLYMKIIPITDPEENEAPVSKVVFCNAHAPPGESPYQPMITHSVGSDDEDDDDDSSSRPFSAVKTTEAKAIMRKKKITEARIILAERCKLSPTISIPVLSSEALTKIAGQVHLEGKEDFLDRLKAYWTLKRQSRNGVPLLRRLQINHKTGHQHRHHDKDGASSNSEESNAVGGVIFPKNQSPDSKIISSMNIKTVKLEGEEEVSNQDLVNSKCELDTKNLLKTEMKTPKTELIESKSLIEVPLLSDENSAIKRRSKRVSLASRSPFSQRSQVLAPEDNLLPMVEKEKMEKDNSVLEETEIGKKKELKQKSNVKIKIKIPKIKRQKRNRSVSESPQKSESDEAAAASAEVAVVAATPVLKKKERKLRKKKKFDYDFETTEQDPKLCSLGSNVETEVLSGIVLGQKIERKHRGRKRKRFEEDSITLEGKNKTISETVESAERENACEKKKHKRRKLVFESHEKIPKKRKSGLNHKHLADRSVDEVTEKNHDTVGRAVETDGASDHLERLKVWQKLRRGLELSRLLLELIQKREKHKLAQVILQEKISKLRLKPFSLLLHCTLDQLQEKDKRCIFAQPVSAEEVPDYLDYIKCPMDFSTMRGKIENHKYRSISEFQLDFDLIISNCTTYNAKETIYYSAAIKLRDQAQHIFEAARKAESSAGYDPDTGLHLEVGESVQESPYKNSSHLVYSESREGRPLGDQLQLLQDRLKETEIVNPNYNACASWQLKKKIAKLRRQLSILKSNGSTPLTDTRLNLPSDASETAVAKQDDTSDATLSPHLTQSAFAIECDSRPEFVSNDQGTTDKSTSVAQVCTAIQQPTAQVLEAVKTTSHIRKSRRGRKKHKEDVISNYEENNLRLNSGSHNNAFEESLSVMSNKDSDSASKLTVPDNNLEDSIVREKSEKFEDVDETNCVDGIRVKVVLLGPPAANQSDASSEFQARDDSIVFSGSHPASLTDSSQSCRVASACDAESKLEFALTEPSQSLFHSELRTFNFTDQNCSKIENSFDHLVLLAAKEVSKDEEAKFDVGKEAACLSEPAFDRDSSETTTVVVDEEAVSEEASVTTIILDTEQSDFDTKDSLENSFSAEQLEPGGKTFSEVIEMRRLESSSNALDETSRCQSDFPEIVDLDSSAESGDELTSDSDESSAENSAVNNTAAENQPRCWRPIGNNCLSSTRDDNDSESVSVDDRHSINTHKQFDTESEDEGDDDDDDDDDESTSDWNGC